MDHVEYQTKHALVKLNNFQILKLITQLLFSVSVFSFLCAQSSWLSFPSPSKFYFPKLTLHLFSHNIDKNYIFLLCNGLLVFLAKYSGLLRTLSSSSRNDVLLKAFEDVTTSDSIISETKAPLVEGEVLVLRTGSAANVVEEQPKEFLIEEERRETKYPTRETDEEEREIKLPVSEEAEESGTTRGVEEEGEEEDSRSKTGFLYEERLEEDDKVVDEEANEMLSTAELNRKFDDFIRRMKEEIRTQARQQ